jgi:hypothetical protein
MARQGVTLLHDVRTGRWASLYGWDSVLGMQTRWPGWSYIGLWGRHFVGGEGLVMELKPGTTKNMGLPMPTLLRTGHLDAGGNPFRIDDMQMRMKRGQADPNTGKRPPRLDFSDPQDSEYLP